MTKVAFVGAGSVVFTRNLLGDILSFPELREIEIALHDIDADRLATAESMARHVARACSANPVISAQLDRRAALDGADFVLNMVQIGGHDATLVDFEIPARYGLRQTIADTLGIGGIFRTLRTADHMLGIGRELAELAPNAWLLNYTNPMAMNVAYLGAIAPDLKVVGLCHSVYWTVRGLCEVIDVPFEGVSYRAAGLNHQAWLMHWAKDGEDLYPRLDAAIAADPELRRRVRVDMYRSLGVYPTETSEHSSEYVPWYLHHEEEIARLRIPVGDYLGISEANLAEYAAVRAAMTAGEPLDLERDACEYAPQVIHSITTGTMRRIHGNVRNTGLITNLPMGYAVEVPCVVDEQGVRPEFVGDLPLACAAVNQGFASVGRLTVEAAVTGDARMVRQAAQVDPNAGASLTVDAIWAICDELTAAHGDLLPESLRTSVTR
jgi:alpha-galactosidase